MEEPRRSPTPNRTENAKLLLARLARTQFGLASRAQMIVAGIHPSAITRWMAVGYLHRVLPRVYAVGHTAPRVEAELSAALLYAGKGAMLSHATAAWWLGLI